MSDKDDPTSYWNQLKKNQEEKKELPSSIEDIVKQREGIYGHPYDNFNNISNLWSDYLSATNQTLVQISREDVAMMMVLFKVARSIHTFTEDTITDIAGYAKCAQMIREMRESGQTSQS